MNSEETIARLRGELSAAVGAIQALADIAEKSGNPKTAAKALELAEGYLQTVKDTTP